MLMYFLFYCVSVLIYLLEFQAQFSLCHYQILCEEIWRFGISPWNKWSPVNSNRMHWEIVWAKSMRLYDITLPTPPHPLDKCKRLPTAPLPPSHGNSAGYTWVTSSLALMCAIKSTTFQVISIIKWNHIASSCRWLVIWNNLKYIPIHRKGISHLLLVTAVYPGVGIMWMIDPVFTPFQRCLPPKLTGPPHIKKARNHPGFNWTCNL